MPAAAQALEGAGQVVVVVRPVLVDAPRALVDVLLELAESVATETAAQVQARVSALRTGRTPTAPVCSAAVRVVPVEVAPRAAVTVRRDAVMVRRGELVTSRPPTAGVVRLAMVDRAAKEWEQGRETVVDQPRRRLAVPEAVTALGRAEAATALGRAEARRLVARVRRVVS